MNDKGASERPRKDAQQEPGLVPSSGSSSELETEAAATGTFEFDRLPASNLVAAMHAADCQALAAVHSQLLEVSVAVERIAERLAAGGRLFYIGAGTSGRLGVLDAAECPPTFDSPPWLIQGIIAGGDRALRFAVEGAEDDAEQSCRDLSASKVGPQDTLVGIAASGRTPYVLSAIQYAKQQGAWTVGLSCVPGSAVALTADHAITPCTGPEVIVGSTRLKAGTATKLILNMISTGAMVRMGYVYGNLMVNVQPTNGKLRDRAARLVRELTGLSHPEAVQLLNQAGSVRVAVIMHRLTLDRRSAEERLRAAGGRLRGVIG